MVFQPRFSHGFDIFGNVLLEKALVEFKQRRRLEAANHLDLAAVEGEDVGDHDQRPNTTPIKHRAQSQAA